MKVDVDISEVHELTSEAKSSLGRQRSTFKRILDSHAAEARRRHAYRNRTGNLQDSTFAGDIEGDASEFSVEFGARMPYASFVERLGLQDIEGRAAEAATEIEYMFEGAAEALDE